MYVGGYICLGGKRRSHDIHAMSPLICRMKYLSLNCFWQSDMVDHERVLFLQSSILLEDQFGEETKITSESIYLKKKIVLPLPSNDPIT